MRDRRPDEPLDPRLRAALAGVGVFGALFALGALLGWGNQPALSVAVGALVAFLNLYALGRIGGGLVAARAEDDGSSGMWGVFALAKVLVLFGGVWALMARGLVSPIPLVVGWGSLPVGVAVATLFSGGDDGLRSARSTAGNPASTRDDKSESRP